MNSPKPAFKKKATKEFTPSSYQKDIFEFVNIGKGNALVEAVAGSGKTTTIVEALQFTPKDAKVAFVAFNVAIANELKDRAPDHVQVSTLHSLGLKNITNWLGTKPKVDDNKVFNILESVLDLYDRHSPDWELVSPLKKMVSLAKATLVDPNDPIALDQMCDRYGIELNGYGPKCFSLLPVILEKCKRLTGLVDFDDMVWMPSALNIGCEQFDFLMVDEAQDLNAAQIQLVLKSIRPEGRVIGVGDRNQCQPVGTRVLVMKQLGNRWNEGTTFNEVLIENLQVGDEIVSYSTEHGCYIYRTKVNAISKRLFKGKLRTIKTADGKEHSVTPNHRCLVKWNDKAAQNAYCVYLMRKDNWFRVGASFLMKDPQGVGPRGRLTTEEADCLWILKIFENRVDAMIEEQCISYIYGIPQTRFCGTDGLGSPQSTIDRIYNRVSKVHSLVERAEECLKFYGKDIEEPLCCKDDYQKFQGKRLGRGAKFLKISAANLEPGWMLIPTMDINNPKKYSITKADSFVEFELNIDEVEVDVYGLDVDKHHTYVSNGILTGNSIYGFRGADTQAIPNLIEALGAKTLPLSITYRCPKSHVELAQTIVPEIEAAEWAKEGSIDYLPMIESLPLMKSGDMVLCRTNAPLIEVAFALIRSGQKAVMRGRDIGKNLINIVQKMKAKGIHDFWTRLRAYEARETAKLLALEKTSQLQALQDKLDTIVAIGEDVTTVEELVRKIEDLFSDDIEGVVCSSVHRSKGLESSRVFLVRSDLMPHPMAQKPWEQVQEQNILYVAVTRSKSELIFVEG